MIWSRLGDVSNYVEPFAGSLAVLLARPHVPRIETANDKDCYLANFWRAVVCDPQTVAAWADWPVNECDLHARHRWLCDRPGFREHVIADPDYYDAKVAGWWVWGVSQWIGSGWCMRPEWMGRGQGGRAPRGLNTVDNRHPQLSSSMGIHSAGPRADLYVDDRRPYVGYGNGVHQKRPQLSSNAMGGVQSDTPILDWMLALAARIRRLRVCCGDWSRVVTPSCTYKLGGEQTVTGVLLDPPYDLRIARSRRTGSDGAAPTDKLYASHDNDLSAEVRAWAIKTASNRNMRIALCGLEAEHEMPSDWEPVYWNAPRGYSRRKRREVIWFSPSCIKQRGLLDSEQALGEEVAAP